MDNTCSTQFKDYRWLACRLQTPQRDLPNPSCNHKKYSDSARLEPQIDCRHHIPRREKPVTIKLVIIAAQPGLNVSLWMITLKPKAQTRGNAFSVFNLTVDESEFTIAFEIWDLWKNYKKQYLKYCDLKPCIFLSNLIGSYIQYLRCIPHFLLLATKVATSSLSGSLNPDPLPLSQPRYYLPASKRLGGGLSPAELILYGKAQSALAAIQRCKAIRIAHRLDRCIAQ